MSTVCNPHILIVEDDPASLELLSSYFRLENYQVFQALNAHDASRAVEQHEIDIILLDIVLPDGDGLTLTKHIRKSSDVGIILVTHKKEDLDVIIGLELGADDYVTKPYNIRELYARVKNLYRNPTPELRANIGLNWMSGRHSANIFFRYVDSYQNDVSGDEIDDFSTIDLQYSVSLGDIVRDNSESAITVGLVNATDEEPPFVDIAGSYDPRTGDPRGRRAYIKLSTAF